jgi:hypothetical protein
MVRLRWSVLALVCSAGLVAGCCSNSCDRRPFWERWFGNGNGHGAACCESGAPGCCDPMGGSGDMGPMLMQPPPSGTLTPPTAVPPGTAPPIRPVPNQPMAPMTGAPMSQPQAYAPPWR